uniref:Uncharacterized protein TCIL3000_11_16110 n=1 Tax=Trypanosoma congolense (strain IL3000) TaxID=1068625 RepID=G0V378_TRYCI|nr:unnamed protein product [Trypanosoma congolense IL3000]
MTNVHFLCIVSFLVILGLTKTLTPHSSHLILPRNYSQEGLSERYGNGRNLDHKGVRKLYITIINNIRNDISSMTAYPGLSDRAAFCSALRWQARLYARSRDGSYYLPWLTDWVLRLRDTYVYSFKHIAPSFVSDIYDAGRSRLPFQRTTLVIEQMWTCLFTPVNSTGCPSYSFLRQVRGRSDTDILSSCTKTDPKFDRILH